MFQNIFYTIFILSLFTVYSYGAHISEYNERELLLSMNSQLSELKEVLTNEVAKDSDIQLIRAEIERPKNCELDKETETQFSRADIQLFKTDIQNLRAELESQKKYVFEKEAAFESLRAEVERQGKLIEGLVKEADKHHNCSEAKFSGIHDVLIPNFGYRTFEVACDAETREGGWTIILRRMDGSVNFYRNWTEYKNGFGNLDGEYFLGLDKIHAMTAEMPQELLIVLEDFEGDERFETYDEFAIGDESQQYKLHTLGKANGTARDSLSGHRGRKFSTFDRDNDDWKEINCAIRCTGAWWYNSASYCQTSQLTGTYKVNKLDKGVTWDSFRGYEYSLKTAMMMIRPIK